MVVPFFPSRCPQRLVQYFGNALPMPPAWFLRFAVTSAANSPYPTSTSLVRGGGAQDARRPRRSPRKASFGPSHRPAHGTPATPCFRTLDPPLEWWTVFTFHFSTLRATLDFDFSLPTFSLSTSHLPPATPLLPDFYFSTFDL